MRFKKDLTGNSDRVRAYLKYYEKCEGKPLDPCGVYTFTRSWSNKNSTPVPDYFNIEYLTQIVSAEGKEIPEFVVKWLAYYLSTTPERMNGFTPENEIKCIIQERKFAAAQVNSAENALLELWAQIPDYSKMDAIREFRGTCNHFINMTDQVEILRGMQANVITFPLQLVAVSN